MPFHAWHGSCIRCGPVKELGLLDKTPSSPGGTAFVIPIRHPKTPAPRAPPLSSGHTTVPRVPCSMTTYKYGSVKPITVQRKERLIGQK